MMQSALADSARRRNQSGLFENASFSFKTVHFVALDLSDGRPFSGSPALRGNSVTTRTQIPREYGGQ
jgi:hypothetical protein